MAEVSVLELRLYGHAIGTLTNVPGDQNYFAFNEDYVADENRAVLGLHFKDRFGNLRTEFGSTQTRLSPFFSNLLPEGPMRAYLAEQAGVKPVREFFLLWALGSDLPGALTVGAAGDEGWPAEANTATDRGSSRSPGDEGLLRFSLAGVQLKFSAIDEATGGLTIPAQGIGGHWIVKLPSTRYQGVPENEYSMMTLARLVGIDVPAVRLIDLAEIQNLPRGIGDLKGRALAIERFDRLSDGGLVHIEDFAQVFGVYPDDKYGKASARNIAAVLAVETSTDDIAEFTRRLTFNTLIGNGDMHLKNWSLMYPDRRTAALAPAYDFVSTISYIPDGEAALKFSRTNRFDGFSEDELSHLAAKAGLPRTLVIDTARETTELFRQFWSQEKQNLPLARKTVEAIEGQLKIVPIARR